MDVPFAAILSGQFVNRTRPLISFGCKNVYFNWQTVGYRGDWMTTAQAAVTHGFSLGLCVMFYMVTFMLTLQTCKSLDNCFLTLLSKTCQSEY